PRDADQQVQKFPLRRRNIDSGQALSRIRREDRLEQCLLLAKQALGDIAIDIGPGGLAHSGSPDMPLMPPEPRDSRWTMSKFAGVVSMTPQASFRSFRLLPRGLRRTAPALSGPHQPFGSRRSRTRHAIPT